MTYQVYTQHGIGGFIVPISVPALGPEEAARERFHMMNDGSQRNTTALLVVGRGRAWVYPVTQPDVPTPTVGPALVVR